MSPKIPSMKWLSSLSKVFPEREPESEFEFQTPSFFSNEVFSFQCAYYAEGRENNLVRAEVSGSLAPFVKIRQVCLMPVRFAGRKGCDSHYISCEPGLYPDLLQELTDSQVRLYSGQWQSLFLTVDLREVKAGEIPYGRQELCLQLIENSAETEGEEVLIPDKCAILPMQIICESRIELEVINRELPRQKLFHTEWFHADCLADYYKVAPFGEEHWEILEHFISHYGKSGMNTILIPTFTPALDTAVGHERTTVQLVEVEEKQGRYRFGFDRLYRFIQLCQNAGITHFEIAHLFTQWGAKAAPKIMAVRDGKLQKIFGWETDAKSPGYLEFLKQYLTALTEKLEEWNLHGRVFFHLSDEPEEQNLKDYTYLKKQISDCLKGYPVLDAVSRYPFYEQGVVERPVPGINHLKPFLENKVSHLWTYYCGAQEKDVSNRYIAMPSERTRVLGVLLYYHGIEGFLHWGYNFYNTQYSLKQINPYAVTDAGGAFPSGDPFLVYPGENGYPEESLRMVMLAEAMQDIRALELLESVSSREEALALIEACAGEKLTMEQYPHQNGFLLTLRKKVNERIRF